VVYVTRSDKIGLIARQILTKFEFYNFMYEVDNYLNFSSLMQKFMEILMKLTESLL